MNWYSKLKVYANKHHIEETDEEISEMIGNKWTPVDSSFISAVAYYAPLEIFELKIKDKHGTIREYTYKDVPKDVYDKFMKAKSKGTFFNSFIVPNYGLASN